MSAPRKMSSILDSRYGIGGGVTSRARGGQATSPMRPLKQVGPAKVKLVQGPAPTRAEKERQRREAMD